MTEELINPITIHDEKLKEELKGSKVLESKQPITVKRITNKKPKNVVKKEEPTKDDKKYLLLYYYFEDDTFTTMGKTFEFIIGRQQTYLFIKEHIDEIILEYSSVIVSHVKIEDSLPLIKFLNYAKGIYNDTNFNIEDYLLSTKEVSIPVGDENGMINPITVHGPEIQPSEIVTNEVINQEAYNIFYGAMQGLKEAVYDDTEEIMEV